MNAGYQTISHNYLRVKGETVEKGTKTHQMRRISLDPATVEVLSDHRQRYEAFVHKLDIEPSAEAYLFSYEPARDRPYDPSGVTHWYARMCAKVGIDSHFHAVRHYSATELLTAGVDLRTVAGRLGHAGGGATTLRMYAAWVGESDRRAAEILGGRLTRPIPQPEIRDKPSPLAANTRSGHKATGRGVPASGGLRSGRGELRQFREFSSEGIWAERDHVARGWSGSPSARSTTWSTSRMAPAWVVSGHACAPIFFGAVSCADERGVSGLSVSFSDLDTPRGPAPTAVDRERMAFKPIRGRPLTRAGQAVVRPGRSRSGP